MNIIAIIPARMGSSRFPGKPLADIHRIPSVGLIGTISTTTCKKSCKGCPTSSCI